MYYYNTVLCSGESSRIRTAFFPWLRIGWHVKITYVYKVTYILFTDHLFNHHWIVLHDTGTVIYKLICNVFNLCLGRYLKCTYIVIYIIKWECLENPRKTVVKYSFNIMIVILYIYNILICYKHLAFWSCLSSVSI